MTCVTQRDYVLLSSPFIHQLGDDIQTHMEALGISIPHHRLTCTTFANGEVLPRIPDTVRGKHMLFLHAFHPNPNDNLMFMFIANDALRRASAASITLILPYMPCMRQDRIHQPRAPISARLLADLIESNRKVEHIITIDMHAEQEQGFFSIPVDNLTGVKIFAEHVKEKFARQIQEDQVIILAPDFGGAVRNRRLARTLDDMPVSICEKRRTGPNQAEILSTPEVSVKGKTIVMFEDMVDTGGTAIKVVDEVKKMGARAVYLCATHGIFSGEALQKFAAKNIQVAVTDSIPRPAEFYPEQPWLTKVTVARYFAEAICENMQTGGSISKLIN